MSGSKHAPPQGSGDQVRAYIREMLESNPIYQAEQIIRRRREVFGFGPPSHSQVLHDPVRRQQLVQRAENSLSVLQERFFELPVEKLQRHLKAISHDAIPQFAAISKRLHQVAQARESLLRISQESTDEKFKYSLLRSSIGSASEAAELREQYIEAIISEGRIKSACAEVAKVVERYPDVYRLHQDWFDLFLNKKNRDQWIKGHSSTAINSSVIWSACMIAVLVVVLIAVIADDKPSPNRQNDHNFGRNAATLSKDNPELYSEAALDIFKRLDAAAKKTADSAQTPDAEALPSAPSAPAAPPSSTVSGDTQPGHSDTRDRVALPAPSAIPRSPLTPKIRTNSPPDVQEFLRDQQRRMREQRERILDPSRRFSRPGLPGSRFGPSFPGGAN